MLVLPAVLPKKITLLPTDLLSAVAQLSQAPYAFEMLIDLVAVDYLHYQCSNWQTQASTREGFSRGKQQELLAMESTTPTLPRFALIYNLLSLQHNQRLELEVFLDDTLQVPSVIGYWQHADWYEREAFDLFGIYFIGHPDLRKILTDEQLEGHPLRKDYPLWGHTEVRYDSYAERVVYEPVDTSNMGNEDFLPKVYREEHGTAK
jgi:NADH-quinone oxidoreductase subunit C